MMMLFSLLLVVVIVGCGTSSIDFSVDTPPKYKDGESFPMVIEATEDGEAVTGLDIVATLEMAKMDHGIIEVVFTDQGDGTYVGDVELPMAGEWIADLTAKNDKDTYEATLIFEVKEG